MTKHTYDTYLKELQVIDTLFTELILSFNDLGTISGSLGKEWRNRSTLLQTTQADLKKHASLVKAIQ